MNEPIVLGIESTCDETAAAVVRGRTLLSNVVASSMQEHARYGGVIPEIASRAHAEAFVPCVSKALADANMTLSDVDAIAVSAGPGLAGCLAVGVSGAKALAWASGKPLYGNQPCDWAYRRNAAAVRSGSREHHGVDRLRRAHVAAACDRHRTQDRCGRHHAG